MTCIVGWTDGKTVTIGGDSAGYCNLTHRVRSDEKVFKNGDFIFGFTSSFRMGQLLRYKWEQPEQDDLDDDTYINTKVIDSFIDTLKDNNYAREINNEIKGGEFIFGFNGKLYGCHTDFQIVKPSDPYECCGCGEEYALGALKQMENEGKLKSLDGKDIVTNALEVANYFSAGVLPPFNIVTGE